MGLGHSHISFYNQTKKKKSQWHMATLDEYEVLQVLFWVGTSLCWWRNWVWLLLLPINLLSLRFILLSSCFCFVPAGELFHHLKLDCYVIYSYEHLSSDEYWLNGSILSSHKLIFMSNYLLIYVKNLDMYNLSCIFIWG